MTNLTTIELSTLDHGYVDACLNGSASRDPGILREDYAVNTIFDQPSVLFGPALDEREIARMTSDPSDEMPDKSMSDLNRRLDDALEETFPASDPVSIICGQLWL